MKQREVNMQQVDAEFREAGWHLTRVRLAFVTLVLMAHFSRAATSCGALVEVLGGPYLIVEWGWDESNPLRPWPVFDHDVEPGGFVYTRLTWCGFQLAVSL
jgi:hypothetical protein